MKLEKNWALISSKQLYHWIISWHLWVIICGYEVLSLVIMWTVCLQIYIVHESFSSGWDDLIMKMCFLVLHRVKPYPPPNCTLFVNMLVNGKRRETWDLLSLKGRDGGVWRMRVWLCVSVRVIRCFEWSLCECIYTCVCLCVGECDCVWLPVSSRLLFFFLLTPSHQ